MATNIITIIDNNNEILNELNDTAKKGDNLAAEIVKKFESIFGTGKLTKEAMETIKDIAISSIVDFKTQDKKIKTPKCIIEWVLAMYNDYGLSKWGLTRQEYEAWRLHGKVIKNE